MIDINFTQYFNTSNIKGMKYMSYNCFNLESIDINNFNTKKVIDMAAMFSRCLSLKSIDFSNFDSSNEEKYEFYALWRLKFNIN